MGLNLMLIIAAIIWCVGILRLRAKSVELAREILGRSPNKRSTVDQLTMGWGKIYTTLQATPEGQRLAKKLWGWTILIPLAAFLLFILLLPLLSGA